MNLFRKLIRSLRRSLCRLVTRNFDGYLQLNAGCIISAFEPASNYGTNLGERYAANVLERYFEKSVQPLITNDDYEKLVSSGGTEKILVKTFGDLNIQAYTSGSTLTAETPSESEAELDPSEQKAYYFKIPSIEKFEDYVNDPASKLIERAESQLREGVDTYILGLYADVGSGNRVGTNYTTGTISVAVTSGIVYAQTTCVWTEAMEGLGFKATGHTKWYRIETYTGATHIIIEDDSDDAATTGVYSGGAIAAGTAYVIEAATAVAITIGTTDMDTYVAKMALRLDENKIPKDNRWLVVNARGAAAIKTSTSYTPAVESAYQDVVQKGMIGWFMGFQVFQNEQVAGNNTTGYYILAGHKSAITFAMEFKESGVEDLIGDFGKAYKGLIVYGAKIADERRKALTYFWGTFT